MPFFNSINTRRCSKCHGIVWSRPTEFPPKSLFAPALVPSADGYTVSIPNDKIMQIFAQDGNEQVTKLLIDNNRPEPAIPNTEKMVLKNPAFTSVPKYYIHTRQDRAITIDLQNTLVAATGIKNVYAIDSGHCPMLTKPDEVTALLLQIIK